MGRNSLDRSDDRYTNRDSRKTVTLEGMLIPMEWGKRKEITRIALLTDDQDEYAIEGEVEHSELLEHLDDDVRVRGTVGTNRDGQKCIRVSRFEVIGDGGEESTWD